MEQGGSHFSTKEAAMKRHLLTRLLKSGLTFLLVLIVMSSISGTAFAFKAPDSEPETTLKVTPAFHHASRGVTREPANHIDCRR